MADDFEADERIIRLRFLHEADEGYCGECSQMEDGHYVPAPCPTIRTLDGEAFWLNTPDELSPLLRQTT